MFLPTYRPVPSQAPSDSAYPPRDKSSPVNIPILTLDPAKERWRAVGLRALGPVVIVVLLSGGLATGLILWLYFHALVDYPPQTLSTIWQTGYFLANEGTEIVNGLQRAKSNGLTISAATSHIISSTNSVISGIFAYNIAAQLLSLSNPAAQGGGYTRLPTPLQFGLLLCLCHAGTLGSMAAVFLYIVKKGSRKVPVSPLLIQAISLLTVAYLLTHGVGLADFFLHKNTATVKYLLRDKELAPLPYGRSFNVSVCGCLKDTCTTSDPPFNGSSPMADLDITGFDPIVPADDGKRVPDQNFLGCFMKRRPQFVADHQGDAIREQSLLSVANTSTNTLAHLVDRGLSLAVSATGVKDFPQDDRSMFSTSSIAVSMKCEMISGCKLVGSQYATSCPGLTRNVTGSNGIVAAPVYDAYGAIPNPFHFLFYYIVQLYGDEPPSIQDPNFPDPWFIEFNTTSTGDDRNARNTMIANCTVSVNDAEYTWSNGSYTLGTVTPTSGFVAGAIFGPTIEMTASSNLIGQIQLLAMTAHTISDFETGLSNLMANAMIARAAGLLMPVETTTAVTFSSLLITQYPIAPLLVLLFLLYTYSLLAVGVMAAAIFISSSSIQVQRNSGGSQRISMLALAQRSIVSPLGIMAAMFTMLVNDESASHSADGGEAAASRARASAAVEDATLFGESKYASENPRHVIVGLGGGDSTQPAFGVWLAQEDKSRMV